ncbi:MAG: c-type cytochrome [Betaproteobacteria bacterium]
MRTAAPVILAVALAAAAAPAAAADRERTGEEIVRQKCSECHATGQHGAPRIDDRSAWVPRMKSGLDATVRSAIRGHGKMPARGGMADLTDTELRAAVLYMFNTAGPPTPPPPRPALGPNQKIVDGMEVFLGVKPVKEGVYHVNVTLRDETSHAAIEDAQVEVSVTNPVMGTETRKLAKTTHDKAVSYGSDFRLSGKEPHVITVQIRRPNQTRVTQAKFDYSS